MFAYCLNNPVNYVDHEGRDAIYVADYRLIGGLFLVGHASLFYQDESGEWWLTQLWGKKKISAKIYNQRAVLDDIDAFLEKRGQKTYYLKGDYSDIYEFAERHKDTNYGGYNLLYNNCLSYVDDALNYARYGDNKSSYDHLYLIFPVAYTPNTSYLSPSSGGTDAVGGGSGFNYSRTFSVKCVM